MKKLMLMAALLGLVATTVHAITYTNRLGQVITDLTLEESLTNEAYATPQQVDQSDYAKFPNRFGYFYRTYDSDLNGSLTGTNVLNPSFDSLPSNAIPLTVVVDVWKAQTPNTNTIAFGFGGSTNLFAASTNTFASATLVKSTPVDLQLTNDLDLTVTVLGVVTQWGFNVYGTYFLGN